ncbi:MAG: ABC transporter ATP-binding protein [Bacteroidales bacterium]|nr:ABC transporter ATP-binding protein [Bacteroidales bacterium]MDT8372709.1 ABC transporter ATP-binding protein [Bacteroidales bacterium]
MSTPAIDITGLTKTYGRDRGIEDVNLRIEEGEIFGFIGPNGAGKSTTIRVLLNLLFPTSGKAQILGLDVARDSKEIKYHTGYVPSDANAYSQMEADEFFRYCGRFFRSDGNERRIRELTELFEVDRRRKISDLSMGNRKKISIIQSLLHKPKLLIVDEPTTGLDPLMQARFFELLRSENHRGMTVFYSSHSLSDVQMLCRRVAIIGEGRIITVEEIEALRKRQLKKIYIEFNNSENNTVMELPGIEDTPLISGRTVKFLYSGDINRLISALHDRGIADMTIEEPSLEEIFMHYYY